MQSQQVPSPCLNDRSMAHFQIEQELLPPQSAAIASKSAALVDDAMARNDDGDAIEAIRRADGANGLAVADGNGNVFIRTSRAIGNLQQLRPHAALKVRARIDERHGEFLQIAR